MNVPAVRAHWVRPILVANLVGQIGIVITGGVVRLTGSGLGCPTWPECVPGSFTPVAEQAEGYHVFIEFGNRTLTGVVGILAVLALWAVWSQYPQRRRLRALGYAVVAGVAAQALVGGLTVRTGLNPFTVAFHFLASMALVAVSVALLRGAADAVPDDGPGPLLVPRLVQRLAWATGAVGVLVLVLGTIVTGAGPHSGDADQPARIAVDPRTIAWLHADAVMLFLGLLVACLVAVSVTDAPLRTRRSWRLVLIVALAQGLIGYTQYFTGLPEVLVAMHLAGAALLSAALTLAVLNLRAQPI